ncbi:glycosyltransferase family 9 protein [Flavobacterium sp. W20_MBD1_R3]|uniref:glycosyltransferase family 9 protein n=1 Tax=Flavobacterium sp. W20_MBD1_R3 TaxID=3240278 RepID=UPI003F92C8B3
MKILVIQQKMIGDVLISSILCNNLRMAYPDAQIDYLVYKSTTPVLEGNLSIDNIILFEEKHRNSKKEFFRLALQIRATEYDILIDAYSKLESWLIVLLSGAKRKISYQKKGRNFLYTDNVPFAAFPKTNLGLAIERRLSLLEPLDLPIEIDPLPKLFVTQKENEEALCVFEQHQLQKNRKTVLISLLGSEKLKTYPLEYMAKVVDTIADNQDVNILFNYFPKQIEDAKIIFDACKTATKEKIYFDLLAKDLRGFIAIMNQCDLIIGNDGGAINMAKALGKPSFIIFSPWIEKKIWATFEDGIQHMSVHLNDFKPQLFHSKTEKELKKEALSLYLKLTPDLFEDKIEQFLNQNLNNTQKSNLTVHQNKVPVSALIITYNEAENIKSAINDLDFAAEIIVIDSFSTDQTTVIASSHDNVTVVQHTFENYAAQRNFAISLAQHNWILFLDADERISAELKDEIMEVVSQEESFSAYFFHRTFMFQNKKLFFSGWQTDKIFRLFKKDKANYASQKIVHEKLIVNGSVGKLKNKLIHFSYKDHYSYKQKMIHYGKLKAKEEFNKGTQPNFFHFYIRPLYQFLYQYLIRLGFLDGKKGIIICYLNALSVFVRFQELKKMKSN